jgi:hypothetical protein
VSQEVTEFFRCVLCGRVREMREEIKKQRIFCKCGAKKATPTRITLLEAAQYLITHPSVLFETVRYRILGR